MKKIFTILCTALFAFMTINAQQPVITFEKTSHDFGKINEADGRVSTVFTFKNEGMSPLILSNVRASCGCTTPVWPREPIEPGQTGRIQLHIILMVVQVASKKQLPPLRMLPNQPNA